MVRDTDDSQDAKLKAGVLKQTSWEVIHLSLKLASHPVVGHFPTLFKGSTLSS